MSKPPFPILLEDNHLLAVDKPVGLPTMGVVDRDSLISQAKDYIKQKYNKPGNVYLGVVSRLDARVSGVVLIARTSKAAARLNEQYRSREVKKLYWALVVGHLSQPQGNLTNWMRKDERHRRMHVCGESAEGAQDARLSYRQLAQIKDNTLLEIELETGRKHQIRVQLAACGHPILGDRKYGSPQYTFPDGIALHSHELFFTHPVQKTEIHLTAPLPAAWRKAGVIEK